MSVEYITAKEAAEVWGITARRVQFLCFHNMVPGAARHGKSWAIPKGSEKPVDGRCKRTERQKKNPGTEMNSLISAVSKREKELFSFIEHFPYPLQVYFPNGVMAYINDACLRLLHIPSRGHVIGKFNVLEDSVIDAWGDNVRADITKSFHGEIVRLKNVKIPYPEIISRFDADELCFERSFQDITCFPVYDEDNRLKYVVHLLITFKLYYGKEEIVRAKEYIESNWREDFDLEAVARAVNLSKYHFARLFKKHTAVTPYGFYQEVKLKKLKEALCNGNLSISEAFALCGVDYNGNYARLFRQKTGMTPSQYRNLLTETTQ